MCIIDDLDVDSHWRIYLTTGTMQVLMDRSFLQSFSARTTEDIHLFLWLVCMLINFIASLLHQESDIYEYYCLIKMPSSLFYFDRLKSKKSWGPQDIDFWCTRLRSLEACTSPLKYHPAQKVAAPHSNFRDALNGKLKDDPKDSFYQVHKQKSWPICFIGIKGEDKSVALDKFSGTDNWQK